MKIQSNHLNLHPSHVFLKMGTALAMVVGLVSGLVFPVFAAAAPVITPVSVIPGGYVQVQISNLPANTDFTVLEGVAGTQGIGGSVVAGFNSGSGGTELLSFEVVTALAQNANIDIRIDSGNGIVAWADFSNAATPAAPVASSSTSAVPVAAATTTKNTTMTNQIQVTRDKFGGVVSFVISNLPLETNFLVTIGAAGSGGVGGYVVANLYTGDQTTNVATFEIPVLLEGSAQLDLRLDGPAMTYITTFSNANTVNTLIP